MYKLFLTLRYLRKRRIAIFAVVSVWLCVAMVLVVISVMGGFLDVLKERSRGLLSDIVIDNAQLTGFPFYQEFIDHLQEAMPGEFAAAAPVIYNYGIIRLPDSGFTKPIRVVGIRLEQYEAVNDFANSLYYDKYYPGSTTLAPQWQPVVGINDDDLALLPDDLERAFQQWKDSNPDPEELERYRREPGALFPGPGAYRYTFDGPAGYYGEEGGLAPGIIVGCNIINTRTKTGEYQREYPRGTKIILTLLPLTRGGQLSGESATSVVTRLADDSHTRVHEIDEMCCYVDFDFLQEWLIMGPLELEQGGLTPARTSQILLRLSEGTDADDACLRIEDEWKRFLASIEGPISPIDVQLLNHVSVETWEERQRPFIAAVEKEKILVTLLFGLISVVAVVLIGCIFWMIVVQKTRDIGLIKAVGASAEGVATVFVVFGAAVGLVGAVLGSISGAVFVWYINDIQDALVAIHPQLRVWSPDVYTFDRIPNAVKLEEVAWIAVIAVVASVLGALIPAVLAGRVWPVKALRYE